MILNRFAYPRLELLSLTEDKKKMQVKHCCCNFPLGRKKTSKGVNKREKKMIFSSRDH